MDLPASTVFNRFVPKEKFYNKTPISSKLRQQFTDEIEKIKWTNKIAPDTLNITSKEYAELQVFEITLKKSELNMSVLKHIDTLIPYPILFILKRANTTKAVISHKVLSLKNEDLMIVDSYFETPWSQDLKLELKGRSVDEIYRNYLYQIAPQLIKICTANIKETIEANREREKIQKQIDAINKKIANEPSLAKKQELARKRYALEKQLR